MQLRITQLSHVIGPTFPLSSLFSVTLKCVPIFHTGECLEFQYSPATGERIVLLRLF
jgi:hypothetical protein